jgi:hypothetical protein
MDAGGASFVMANSSDTGSASKSYWLQKPPVGSNMAGVDDDVLEAFGIIGKLSIEQRQKVLYLNWAIYETRIPLDCLDLIGSTTRTYPLAEPQNGDAPVFAKCRGAIRC